MDEVGNMDILGVEASEDIVLHLLGKGYEAYEFDDGRIVKHNLRERYEYESLIYISKRAL